MEIHPWRCIQVSQVQVSICSCPWFWDPTIYSVSCFFIGLFNSTEAHFRKFLIQIHTSLLCNVSLIWYLCFSCSTVFIFILALVGVFYPYNRGALFTALVVIYALTSGIAGYIATSFYCQLEGTNWVCADKFILHRILILN
jgi:hypothetical protein